jgi:hypothetical protein
MNETKCMTAQSETINSTIKGEIKHCLDLLELADFSQKQVEIVRKMLWKMHNDTVKIMNECPNENQSSNKS